MRVLKITAADSSVFYTDGFGNRTMNDWLDALEGQAQQNHGGVERIEIVKMTEEEYRAIPATVQSARLFDIGEPSG